MLMNEKSRCSILFHLLVPGGKWQTVIGTTQFVGQPLQLHAPQPKPGTIAAARISGHEQARGLRVPFLLVSTEITGSLVRKNPRTCRLMYSNCAFRSGWLAPSIVLRFAWRL
jgi:hypothetical protein